MASQTAKGMGFAIFFLLLASQFTFHCHARLLPSSDSEIPQPITPPPPHPADSEIPNPITHSPPPHPADSEIPYPITPPSPPADSEIPYPIIPPPHPANSEIPYLKTPPPPLPADSEIPYPITPPPPPPADSEIPYPIISSPPPADSEIPYPLTPPPPAESEIPYPITPPPRHPADSEILYTSTQPPPPDSEIPYPIAQPPPSQKPPPSSSCTYKAIYNFGDSLSDTGNLIRQIPAAALPHTTFANLPYGETYFHKPTGRCSNGLLIIDYLARYLYFPFLQPYLQGESRYPNGVNFAVAGSTALTTEALQNNGVTNPVTNSSLPIQLDWFNAHVDSVVHNMSDPSAPTYDKIYRDALFIVGEIGGNDYNYAFQQGKSLFDVRDLVPQVIQSITNVLQELLEYHPKTIIVPGNFPIGCLPSYLSMFESDNDGDYDENECLRDYNNFAVYHNEFLIAALQDLQRSHPNTKILYADYYNALLSIINAAGDNGFSQEHVQQACCGTGETYNFDQHKICGMPGTSVCSNVDQYVHWDGVHLTEAAYKHIADFLFSNLNLHNQC